MDVGARPSNPGARNALSCRTPRSAFRAPLVLSLSAVAIVVVALVMILAPPASLLTSWHIWRLSSSDESVRLEAATYLGENQVVRGVPALIAAIGRDPRESSVGD